MKSLRSQKEHDIARQNRIRLFRKAMDDALEERKRHSLRYFGIQDFIYFRSMEKAMRDFIS